MIFHTVARNENYRYQAQFIRSFMGIFSHPVFYNGLESLSLCCFLEHADLKSFSEIRKRLRGSQTYRQRVFAEIHMWFLFHPMEYLFRRLQGDLFFNNPSNTQSLAVFNNRDQATQFARPSEKLKCGASLFKKSWGISRWLTEKYQTERGFLLSRRACVTAGSHPGEVCPANSIFPW